ncbi:MAG: hypothetical protein BWK79_08935, partial [Beggiatoa sp. IS2]
MTNSTQISLWRRGWQYLLTLYHPTTIKQRGLLWSIALFAVTAVVLLFALSFYWDNEPDSFDVQTVAQARAGEKLVTGYVTTSTLIEITSTLLDKPGGYLSNDKLPPSVFMDNVPNWEFGVLIQVRDFAKALRNQISRAQTLGNEHPDLEKAEPQFNIDSGSWLVPAAETEYREGIDYLESYLHKLANPTVKDTQFYTRGDSLRFWLDTVSYRLGDLSQKLSASIGQMRSNTELAGDASAKRSTTQEMVVQVRTPWLEIDDWFYRARGTAWALIHLLRAVEIDFKEVLEKKNAVVSLQQIIRELEATQSTLWSPVVLNGSDFGLFANHSLVMSSYIARANTGIIKLSE